MSGNYVSKIYTKVLSPESLVHFLQLEEERKYRGKQNENLSKCFINVLYKVTSLSKEFFFHV